MGGRRLAGVILCLGLVLAGGALAQTAIDDSLDQNSVRRLDNMEKVVRELRAIIFQGRETGQPVVVQPADTQDRINALAEHLNDLDHSLTTLNGEMDQVRHDLDQTRQDNADLRARNAALNEQVQALEQKVQGMSAPPPPAAAPPAAPTGLPAAPEDPVADFAAAKAMYEAGDLTDAEAAFRDFTGRFGGTRLDPEAHYYLGKTLLARRAWPEAATADIGAIRGWPRTAWAPDAVLDLAKSLAAMGKTADVCSTLGELARRYPKPPLSVARDARVLRAQASCG